MIDLIKLAKFFHFLSLAHKNQMKSILYFLLTKEVKTWREIDLYE